MPHAALWVVQAGRMETKMETFGFNAARGFVGGAAMSSLRLRGQKGFNAARGFVGGATIISLSVFSA